MKRLTWYPKNKMKRKTEEENRVDWTLLRENRGCKIRGLWEHNEYPNQAGKGKKHMNNDFNPYLHGGGTALYPPELNLPPLEDTGSLRPIGNTCIRVAFHLNGMLALKTASTRTLSPTFGFEPFTQQLKI